MSTDTRIHNSKRNMIYGLFCQIVTILFTFINRQTFIILLGKEYLGINGLFSNILTLLSLTEMGLGNAFLFFLYKPIREQDYIRLQALLDFCKRIFYFVSLGIAIIGIIIIPMLPYIVDVNMQFMRIVLYYIIYLMNSVFSYFSVSKSIMIEANQQNYIIKIHKTVHLVIQNIIQIAVLLRFHSYLLYLLIQIGCTVLYNISITYKAYKMYPSILRKHNQKLEKEDKTHIWKTVQSTFVYKLGTVLMNNTDNILISIIITTVAVGYYSNYKMVETVVTYFIGVMISAITASLGDLNAEDNRVHSLKTFRMLVFLFHAIIAFCSICLLLCLNDFIYIWIGETYLFSIDVVVAMVFCFYISNIITPVWVYRETMGLYQETKYLMLVAAFINLVLSVVLGYLIGLSGIIIATGLSRVLSTVWYEPRILFKKKFGENVNSYYVLQLKFVAQTMLCVVIAFWGTRGIKASFIGMIIKVLITFAISFIIFVFFNRKTDEYIYAKEVLEKMLKDIGRKSFNNGH